MRIYQFNAENVKRLRAVEITPDENVVVISGRNAQGKTSVLDAIWLALAGGSASQETPRVIRDGEDEASVTLDLGDFTVTRTWREGKSNLAVMSKDGAKYSSPQTFLNEKLGALSFDPLAFANSEAKKQLETLLSLVELPFDPDELAAHRRGVFDTRTDVNRRLGDAKAQLRSFDILHGGGTPDEEESTADIAAAQSQYEEDMAAAREYERVLTIRRENVTKGEQTMTRLVAELEQAKRHYDMDVDKLDEHASAPVPWPERVDWAERLRELEETNAAVRSKREYRALQEKVGSIQAHVDVLTTELGAIDTSKERALAEAKMPIEGLGFDDDGVTYNGVPFKQASGAEQLRVSIAMAMAMNPQIRVIRISDGSLLDRENMAIIADMAQEHDFQCWIERVDESGGVGFTIEDGEVVNAERGYAIADALRSEVSVHDADPPIARVFEKAHIRMSICSSCGETKPADPTSRYFTARPDSAMDLDWDGCSRGAGT